MSITREQAKTMVGEGWGFLIDKIYDASPISLVVLQVKEKWGGLRFYYGDSTLEFDKIVDEVEKESCYTCELCGAQSEIKEQFGWYKSLCYECREKERDILAKEYKEFMNNLENKNE